MTWLLTMRFTLIILLSTQISFRSVSTSIMTYLHDRQQNNEPIWIAKDDTNKIWSTESASNGIVLKSSQSNKQLFYVQNVNLDANTAMFNLVGTNKYFCKNSDVSTTYSSSTSTLACVWTMYGEQARVGFQAENGKMCTSINFGGTGGTNYIRCPFTSDSWWNINSTTKNPTSDPTTSPSFDPSPIPTTSPSFYPSNDPTNEPSNDPTYVPTNTPSYDPTMNPSYHPTNTPSNNPTNTPSNNPTNTPSYDPTNSPTCDPTETTRYPTNKPTLMVYVLSPTTLERQNVLSSTLSILQSDIIYHDETMDKSIFKYSVVSITLIVVAVLFVLAICIFVSIKLRNKTKKEILMTNVPENNAPYILLEGNKNEHELVNIVNKTNAVHSFNKFDRDIIDCVNKTKGAFEEKGKYLREKTLPQEISPVSITGRGNEMDYDSDSYEEMVTLGEGTKHSITDDNDERNEGDLYLKHVRNLNTVVLKFFEPFNPTVNNMRKPSGILFE